LFVEVTECKKNLVPVGYCICNVLLIKTNNMKKMTLTLCLLFAVNFMFAQEVISTQGESYSNANGSIDFTIGEVVTNTGTDGVNDITQGFHQTNWRFLSVESHVPNYEATIFPNPTSELLNINASAFKDLSYTLYDLQGKLVMQDKLSSEQTSVQVSQLVPGAYTLRLNNETQNLKTFKLIKQH
jgi:hypothetical protein